MNIPDNNLRAAFEYKLGKKSGETITTDEMETVFELTSRSTGITDLTGLEFATGLRELNLTDNQITDILPLSGLTSLVLLYLANNQITDVSPLSRPGPQLRLFLDISSNQITDLSPLTGLTSLIELIMSDNQISDISPLLENSGLGEGDLADLRRNPLDNDSVNVYIAALEERGVSVLVSGAVVDIPDANLRAAVESALGKESGETITTDEIAPLTELHAVASGISDLTGLEYATELLSLNLAAITMYRFDAIVRS